jgi:FkbM family methyltransferase
MIQQSRYGVDFKVAEQKDPELDNFWRNAYPGWEGETYECILPHLSKDKVFLDIGAWQGPISMVAQRYSKQCICFEPDPIAYELLVKNIEINNFQNIIAVNAAVSNEDSLSIGHDQLGGGVSSYLNNQNSIQCKTISFSNILKTFNLNENDISVVKIDIEGYECELLQDPMIQQLNVYKHISLHGGFFENKIEYVNKLKNFFGGQFELPQNEFASIFIHKN